MFSKVLFENKIIGEVPYKNYNCSILSLNKEETFSITNEIYNEKSILIIFYVSLPEERFGSMSWIGIMSYEKLIKLLDNKIDDNDNIWFIKPHLLQNDKGPKCADQRIFKMKKNIGIIGYTRVAVMSNTIGISDYYVRASILDTRINNELYDKPNKLYHFKDIDGGFFPSKIGNNYEKFKIINDKCKINNIEFYIKDNNNSKLITPHQSKHVNMPNEMKLNGIEVSFSKTSTNEDCKTHISTKNIVPLQHINYLDNIGCFVDFTPPQLNDQDNSIINIQDMTSGKVHYIDNILIPKQLKFRGSTPVIQTDNNYWITIVHSRKKSETINQYYKSGFVYDYSLLIFHSKNVFLENLNLNINIPHLLHKRVILNIDEEFNNNFIYITGLVLNKVIFDSNKEIESLEMLISYGISDYKSGISKLNVNLN
tara:strand:- start:1343 stop:2617 length:1275 start_codon:yes stop_codon:yes gene_type:complete